MIESVMTSSATTPFPTTREDDQSLITCCLDGEETARVTMGAYWLTTTTHREAIRVRRRSRPHDVIADELADATADDDGPVDEVRGHVAGIVARVAPGSASSPSPSSARTGWATLSTWPRGSCTPPSRARTTST